MVGQHTTNRLIFPIYLDKVGVHTCIKTTYCGR